jgi:hypothetical protein
MIDEEIEPAAVRSSRAGGLVVMGALVGVGVLIAAGYWGWQAIAKAKHAASPAEHTTEGRLRTWLTFGAPQIHHRIEIMRFSAEEPWLVTHAVRVATNDSEDLEIHGIDLSKLPRDVARIEGTVVRVRLPRPTLLATGPLRGQNAAAVPIAAESAAPDPIARAQYLIHFALDDLGKALERDIPGATLAIEIGPESSWEEIASRAR